MYGASENDDKPFMFKLEASALSVVLPYTQQLEAEADALRFSQHNTLTVPCTVRYMFNDKMMVWNLNAGNVPIGNAAAATPPTLSNMYWGTRNLGQEIDSDTGTYQQQESAPFRVFCEPTEVANGAPGAGGTALVEMDFGSLFDVRSIHQDFAETAAADWINQAGDANVPQAVVTRRNNDAGRAILVMSVGIMDNLQSNSQMGKHARAAKTKHDVFTLMADFGSTCIMRVAHGFQQAHNANTGVRPIMTVLGNADEVQPDNRDRLSVMGGRRPFNQPVLMTPHFVNHHNTQANARPLEYVQDTIYLGNVHFSSKNRRVFVVFNDRGADLAQPRPPTTMVFETDDCEPVLHFDELS